MADSDATQLNTVVVLLVLLITVLLGHAVHLTRWRYISEGCIALLTGLAAGGLLLWYKTITADSKTADYLAFEYDVFFNVLLPPIIFNAGFSMKKKLFFRNCFTILLFGIVGTFFIAAVMYSGLYFVLAKLGFSAADVRQMSMVLGIIFSTTDSVAILQVLDKDAVPVLYSIVFGEGVVNDATSIVLLHAVERMQSSVEAVSAQQILFKFAYLFVTSLAFGVAMGLAASALIRALFRDKWHCTDREVLLVAIMGLLTYIGAEMVGLSAIFAAFFCGITLSHYAWHSLSDSAKVITIYSFRVASFTAELLLFIYCGCDMWLTGLMSDQVYRTSDKFVRRVGLLAAALLVLMITARGVFVACAVTLANRWRANPVRQRDAFTIWWAGLPRGAITVAMIYHTFHVGTAHRLETDVVVLASLVVVLLTTLVSGVFTKPLLDHLLGPPPAVPRHMQQWSLTAPLLHAGSSVTQRVASWRGSDAGSFRTVNDTMSVLHKRWRQFDNRVLQPVFGGRTVSAYGDASVSNAMVSRFANFSLDDLACSPLAVNTHGATGSFTAGHTRSPFLQRAPSHNGATAHHNGDHFGSMAAPTAAHVAAQDTLEQQGNAMQSQQADMHGHLRVQTAAASTIAPQASLASPRSDASSVFDRCMGDLDDSM